MLLHGRTLLHTDAVAHRVDTQTLWRNKACRKYVTQGARGGERASSTTSYYKACRKYLPLLLCTTKLARKLCWRNAPRDKKNREEHLTLCLRNKPRDKKNREENLTLCLRNAQRDKKQQTHTHTLAQNCHCELCCGMHLTCKDTSNQMIWWKYIRIDTCIYIYKNHRRRWRYKPTAIQYSPPQLRLKCAQGRDSIYLNTYIHTYTHTHIHTYTHTHTHTSIHPYMHTCIHASIHPSMHTYIHTHTYIHASIHTYIYT